jgi:Zn-dependent M28 family amino/carboxypeptidase
VRTAVLFSFLYFLSFLLCAQQKETLGKVINKKEVERIERTLSSDEMEGRGLSSQGIRKAAAFISDEFAKAGLKPLPPAGNFHQTFSMVSSSLVNVSGSFDHTPLDAKNILIVSPLPVLQVTEKSGYEIAAIKSGVSLLRAASKFVKSGKNYLVLVDSGFASKFSGLSVFRQRMFSPGNSVVFVLSAANPATYEINARQEISATELSNIVGVLPGKGRSNEYVIFSAHYDHLGTGRAVDGDSIYNGANDDAAGTTAVIMLARYFRALGNNERTLVFAAFTAEESGGFGSQYFSGKLDADKTIAMFNIEMIGTDSKWGKNSAFITGYEKTDMGKILEKNLVGTGFKFYPDPYPEQQLFYRSDNASLARVGVPAHTISTSKMDQEKFYHTVNDEIETLDLDNMTKIIQAIALSSGSIVNGVDMPSRVDTESLK